MAFGIFCMVIELASMVFFFFFSRISGQPHVLFISWAALCYAHACHEATRLWTNRGWVRYYLRELQTKRAQYFILFFSSLASRKLALYPGSEFLPPPFLSTSFCVYVSFLCSLFQHHYTFQGGLITHYLGVFVLSNPSHYSPVKSHVSVVYIDCKDS